MGTTKKFLKGKPLCKVTFKLPKGIAIDATKVALVGEFNDWSPLANPMDANKDGSYKTTFDLESGKSYEYKYLVDGDIWVNDTDADAYVSNGIDEGQNCVVAL